MLVRIAGQHVAREAVSIDYQPNSGTAWKPIPEAFVEIRHEGPEASMNMLHVEAQNWRTVALALAPFIRHGNDCPGEGTLRCWCGADEAQSLLDGVVKMYRRG